MMSYSYATTNHYQQVLVDFMDALNLSLMTVPDCKDHEKTMQSFQQCNMYTAVNKFSKGLCCNHLNSHVHLFLHT